MQLFDGASAEQLLDAFLNDQPPPLRKKITQIIEEHLQDMGGRSHFLGGAISIAPDIFILGYVMHYPGRLAILSGPRLVTTRAQVIADQSIIDQAVGLARVLCQSAWQRWPIEMIQATMDPSAEFEALAIEQAGFEFLAEIQQLELRDLSNAIHGTASTSRDWVRYDDSQKDFYKQWLQDSYRETLDCPLLNTIRSVESMFDGYWRSSNSAQAQSLAIDLPMPQWYATYHAAVSSPCIEAAYMLLPIGNQAWELTYMGVSYLSRGKGLGRHLLDDAIKRASSHGAEKIITYVDLKNDPARYLYEAFGFQAGQRWTTFYWTESGK